MASKLIVFTRKGIHFESAGSGDIQAILVPTRDQVQIFKDIDSGSSQELAQRYGATGQKLLWRLEGGQVVVYGLLDNELLQARKSVRVYLPQDFVSPDTEILFYVLNPHWVVYSVRETDDEGRMEWRQTMIHCKENEAPSKLILQTLTEQILKGVGGKIVVAVHDNPSILAELTETLKPLDIKPVAFENLHVGPQKPLYKHGDFSVLVLAMVMFSVLVLGAAGFYWLTSYREAMRIQTEIEGVKEQIKRVQINEHLGYIREPQPVLGAMQKTFNQQPSAILDAAARLGTPFGSLAKVSFDTAHTGEVADPSQAPDPQVMDVTISVEKVVDKLLLNQETMARRLITNRPWIRSISNVGTGADQMTLHVQVQIQAPSGTPDMPKATEAEASLADAVSATQVSTTAPLLPVSATVFPAAPSSMAVSSLVPSPAPQQEKKP